MSESLLSILLSLGTASPLNEKWAEGLCGQDGEEVTGLNHCGVEVGRLI